MFTRNRQNSSKVLLIAVISLSVSSCYNLSGKIASSESDSTAQLITKQICFFVKKIVKFPFHSIFRLKIRGTLRPQRTNFSDSSEKKKKRAK